MCAGRFDRDLAGRQSLKIASFGTKRNANFSCHGVPTGSMFHATACSAKSVAAWVTFEMDTQQPWIHDHLPFPNYLILPQPKSLPRQ